jgi:UDP-N-acetylglucosamine 1-carboxyvinyltransferase
VHPGPEEIILIRGGARLDGEVSVTGAKNSVLKLLAACLLAPGRSTLRNVPDVLDVAVMGDLLRGLGVALEWDPAAGVVQVDVPEQTAHEADYELVRRIRGSFVVLGPLLARCGRARVALPGGDAIGSRAVDLHVAGLERLGARVEVEHGYVVASTTGLRGTSLWLDIPSVGATENLVMAATLARGTTVIDNAAREPEIVDLCTMLASMGARIGGAGTSTITIEGVDRLRPAEHETVPDRIVTGTFAIAAAMTGGDVFIRGGRAEHLEIPLEKLVAAGATVDVCPAGLRVALAERPRAVDVATLPYPGFPTDLQPLFISLLSVAAGTALVTENLFEGRFTFIDELIRLGADLRTDGHHVLVRGRRRLSAAPVRAPDIRAGAALVLAGLVADGETEVREVYHLDRGYSGFVEQLRGLGADVRRVASPAA